MQLLTRVIIYAVVAVALVFLGYYLASSNLLKPQQVTEQQAWSFVRSYLLSAYPNANITLNKLVPSNYSGSWYIEASVISNSTSPCPWYSIYSFDYPQFNLVSRKVNTYTQNCIPMNYSIGSLIPNPQIATTLASSVNTVKSYLNSYGISNVTAMATIFDKTTAAGRNFTKVYIVKYSAQRANYSVSAILSQVNGMVLGIVNGSK